MQKVLQIVGVVLLGLLGIAGTYAVLWWSTSPEVWYAGEHTSGCDFTENCGCYEKLLQADKEKARKLALASKQ